MPPSTLYRSAADGIVTSPIPMNAWSGPVGLGLLIVLADFLFWGSWPGFTMALYAVAIYVVALLRQPRSWALIHPTLLMTTAVLPVVEHVQLLSVTILIVGLLASLAWLRVIRETSIAWIAAGLWTLVAMIPTAGPLIAAGKVIAIKQSVAAQIPADKHGGTFLYNWALPLGGALVLGSLLISANPVLEQLTLQAFQLEFNMFFWLKRVLFWAGFALILVPLVNPPRPLHPITMNLPSWSGGFGVNAGSVLRALLVFNVFLVIQTLMDVSILFGGAALPDGMTYATYARRGAYPLLITAMLAGAFTLAARPFLMSHGLIKPLLYLWVVQNVLLTLSAMLRLDLYIGAYGLTYMRIYAIIWMGLVAAGLLIVLWQLIKGHTSWWLFKHVTVLGVGALYVCAFVNFANIIAEDALEGVTDFTQHQTHDFHYLCRLGPTAAQAIVESHAQSPNSRLLYSLVSCLERHDAPENWRAWDWRTYRAFREIEKIGAI